MVPPELTSDQQAEPAFQTATGISLIDIASQARERYLSVVPTREDVVDHPWEDDDGVIDRTVWSKATQDQKAHWISACESLVEYLAEEKDSSFRGVARMFAQAYYGTDKWLKLKEPLRIAHEVAVRHVVNMVTAEDDEDVADALDHDWQKWALPRIRIEKT